MAEFLHSPTVWVTSEVRPSEPTLVSGSEQLYSDRQLPVVVEHIASPEPQMKRRGGYMIPHLPHGAAQRQGETRGFCGDLLERAVFLGAFGVTSGWSVLSGYLEAYPIRLQALERWEQKDFALQVPELIHECADF